MGFVIGAASNSSFILFLLALKREALVPLWHIQVSTLLLQGIALACKAPFPSLSVRMTHLFSSFCP